MTSARHSFAEVRRIGIRRALGLISLLSAAGILSLRADVVTDWNETILQAVRNETTPPCLASRNLAILHIAIYDAVNAIRRTHQPYCFEARADGEVSSEAAASAAAHEVAILLYPSRRTEFDALLASSVVTITNETPRINGIQLGREAAQAILALRRDDGASTTIPYIPSDEPGRWRRTPPFHRPPELPQWRFLKPFTMTNNAQFRPPPPPALTGEQYARDMNEVKRLGGRDSTERTSEQELIARFWSDFSYTVTPPGHWNDIARTIALPRKLALEDSVRLFALLNIAMADSAIVCWDAKYAFDYWRPVTAIQQAAKDGNPATQADPGWMPLLPTPAHPEYPSGHSTFSGAAEAVLTHFFGTNAVDFTIGCDALPGVTRNYRSFAAVAEEIGQSRIYGGIHFPSANLAGTKAGAQLGSYVVSHLLQTTGQPTASLNGKLESQTP